MAIRIHITEDQLNLVVKRIIKEEEIEEGIFDGISNIYQGLKGVWRGEGYDFFKHLNSLKGMAKELKRLDTPNLKIMTKLTELKGKISTSTMPQEKKGLLIFEIDKALKNFKEYSEHINNLEDIATQRLQGIKTYDETPKSGLGGQSQENQSLQNIIPPSSAN